MRKIAVALLISGFFSLAARAQDTEEAEPPLAPGLYARFETSVGELIFRLEERRAPKTVANFVGLAEGRIPWTSPESVDEYARATEGIVDLEAREALRAKLLKTSTQPFYDGLIFHRKIAGRLIQGGCPRGDGTGTPGYLFGDEFHPELRHDAAGVLSMAHDSEKPDSNGSQFLITVSPCPELDGRHSVFGSLERGREVLKALLLACKDSSDPKAAPKIVKLSILREGPAAAAWKPEAVLRKDLPEAKRPIDLKKVPKAKETPRARENTAALQVLLIQWRGAYRAHPLNPYSENEARAIAEKLVALARQSGARFMSLEPYSDARTWGHLMNVIRPAEADPVWDQVFQLAPGQVSDPVRRPNGFMIFHNPPRLLLRHILISYRGARGAPAAALERAEAKARAEELLRRLLDGGDFASLAREFSSDRETATRGGELPPLFYDQLEASFAEAAEKLRVGERSAVIETRVGFHIIERRAAPEGSKK